MAVYTSQTYNGRYIQLTVTESDPDPINNRSKLNWNVTVYGANGTWYSTSVYVAINGSDLVNAGWVDPPQGTFPMVNGTSRSGSFWVSHGSDGKKTVHVTFDVAIFNKTAQGWGGDLSLTDLDRTAPTVVASQPSSITSNTMSVTASSGNVTSDMFAIRLKTTGNYGAWQYVTDNATSHVFPITGLANNTTYTIQVAARKASNSVWGYSNEVSAKTLGASTITSASNVTLGNNCSVKWTPLNSTFKFKLKFVLGSWSYTTDYISPNSTSAYTYTGYTIPLSVADQLPNSATGTMTVTLTTYTSGNAQVGSSSSTTFTVTVPSSVVPTISSVTLAEGTQSGFSLYVKSLSTVKATVVSAGAYSSTISSISMKVGDTSFAANLSTGIAESDILQIYGSVSVVTTVTDSRGRTATDTKTITVYDYFQPSASIDIAVSGTTVVTTVTGSIASVNNLNAKSLVITRKRMSDSSTQSYTVNPLSAYNYTATWTQTIADIGVESYEYTAAVTDSKQTVTVKKQTAVICISRLAGGRGVRLFAEAAEEGFWVADIDYTISNAEYTTLAGLLATAYSASSAYAVGDFVTYNSNVYECNTACTAAAWTTNQSKFTLLGGA